MRICQCEPRPGPIALAACGRKVVAASGPRLPPSSPAALLPGPLLAGTLSLMTASEYRFGRFAMTKTRIFASLVASVTVLAACMTIPTARADPPGVQTLPIGAAAPDFKLPGVDGHTYSLKD